MREAFALLLAFLFILSLNSCKEDKPTPPVISTTAITEVTPTTAVSGGNIANDGGATIILKGVCWNTSDNPTIENSTTSDSGTDSFTSKITQLSPQTLYYVRAYATNSAGTSYGMTVSFKTPGDAPALTINPATNITTSSVALNALVKPNSLSTTVSIEFGKDTNYGNKLMVTDNPLTDSLNVSVRINLTDLTELTEYHYRFIAENQIGITVTDDNIFTTTGTVKDVDGNVYKTVLIGNQIWMGENLRTTHFSNWDPILNGEKVANYCDNNSYYFRYNEDPGTVVQYGLLYNSYAATHSNTMEPERSNSVPSGIQGACPTGWHLPSLAEYLILIDHLGGEEEAGGKLKSIELWNSPNEGATNSSNFSALPTGGYDKYNSGYSGLGVSTSFLTSTGRPDDTFVVYLDNKSSHAPIYVVHRCNGSYIRCVKN